MMKHLLELSLKGAWLILVAETWWGVVCPVFPCIAEGVTSTVVIGEACDVGGMVRPPPFNSGELVRGVDGLECEGVSIGENCDYRGIASGPSHNHTHWRAATCLLNYR